MEECFVTAGQSKGRNENTSFEEASRLQHTHLVLIISCMVANICGRFTLGHSTGQPFGRNTSVLT